MTIPASEPDYEAALTALHVLRDELGKMSIRDPSRADAHLGLVFGKYLDLTEGQIKAHQELAERGVDAPFG